MRKGLALACIFAAVLLTLLSLSGARAQQEPPLLVLISIDGLRPDYITQADAHGVKAPNLRRFLAEGTYADGTQGVVPTVTYPSHTTLVTGVWPAKHGILSNVAFDPLQKNQQGWYWYAEDIRVPTLWDAAATAGRATASVQWPATVGAHITWNVPEFWRASTADDAKLLRAVATPGLLQEAAAVLGPYPAGMDNSIESDAIRARYAQWILEKKHPALLTLHLALLDHIEHETGPFSKESVAVLEDLDALVGKLLETTERVAPGRAFLAIVSDHGFLKTEKQLDLFPAFRDAQLFTVDAKGKVTDWKAMPWVAGGSAAIMLKDPNDTVTLNKVRDFIHKLAANPANGIDRVLEGDELHKRGGFPNAALWVSMKPGWRMGTEMDKPVVSDLKPGGTHGASPELPDLRASFFLVGPGVPAGRNLGVIDMRDVAPTLAHVIGLSLPTADGHNLLP
jgi:predicted AlkP superfamily pyrophosphatase or phosphodiesterase